VKPYSLLDRLAEHYATSENPGEHDTKRVVGSFLRKKYAPEKISRLLDYYKQNHDLEEEGKRKRNSNMLEDYVDSIMRSRIRECSRNGELPDMDVLDRLKFKSLVKLVLTHFGYKLLYIPPVRSNGIDFIMHRENRKLAIATQKTSRSIPVTSVTVRKAKYLANLYNCEHLLIVTRGYFDDSAISEAATPEVALIDREKLLPLVKELVEKSGQMEDEQFITGISEEKELIFMEKTIKYPKTKVQVVNIRYYIDEDGLLVFEGTLNNTGKKPVLRLKVEIRIFNRENERVATKIVTVMEGLLHSGEETSFKFSFEDISRMDWKNICRYELRLDYKNVYKTD
jgi:hypothetical protein